MPMPQQGNAHKKKAKTWGSSSLLHWVQIKALSVFLLPLLVVYLSGTATIALVHSVVQWWLMSPSLSSEAKGEKPSSPERKKTSVRETQRDKGGDDPFDDICVALWMFFYLVVLPVTLGLLGFLWLWLFFKARSSNAQTQTQTQIQISKANANASTSFSEAIDKYVVLYGVLTATFVAYAVYAFFLDKSSFDGGSRETMRLRKSPFFEHIARYFSLKLICDDGAYDGKQEQETASKGDKEKEKEKEKEKGGIAAKNYLFCYHPHGILFWGVTGGIAGYVSGVTFEGKTMAELGMHLATISFNVFFPLLREVTTRIGCCQVSWAALNNILSLGKNLFIVPGGARESIYAHQGTFKTLLKENRGFIRLALKQGVPLVPVLSFGENDMYQLLETKPGSILDEVEKTYEHFFGFTVPIFSGRVLWNVPTIMPERSPIHLVFGKPIPVEKFKGNFRSEEGRALVEEVYRRYVDQLQALYNKHEHLWKNRKKGSRLKIM